MFFTHQGKVVKSGGGVGIFCSKIRRKYWNFLPFSSEHEIVLNGLNFGSDKNLIKKLFFFTFENKLYISVLPVKPKQELIEVVT